uniref:Ig-like domain-containing protein n=1 Tax=Oreochromis aureus TaxID=47969 RepID=A0A668TE03_OREAU
MVGRLVSLMLLSTLCKFIVQISLTVAKPGDNVTLTCALSGSDQGLFYWYKLNFGYMVQTVAEGSFDKILFQINNSRFSATQMGNVLSLIIRNVSKKDEAMYFCQAGSSFSMTFKNGTILAVKGMLISLFISYLWLNPNNYSSCYFLSLCDSHRS